MRQTYVIDDAVPEEFQEFVENTVIQQSWKLSGHNKSYFPTDIKNTNYPSYGFAYTIVDSKRNITNIQVYEKVSVPLFDYLKKILELKENQIILNRCFLQLPLPERFESKKQGIHIDNDIDHYVMLYYVTDGDGETVIYEQTKYNLPGNVEKGIFVRNKKLIEHARIPPKKGRIVLFDGSRWHCSSQPKDSLRCVLNFNLV